MYLSGQKGVWLDVYKSSHPVCAKTHTKFASSGHSIQQMFSTTTTSAGEDADISALHSLS